MYPTRIYGRMYGSLFRLKKDKIFLQEIFLDLQGLSDSGTAEQSDGDVVGKNSKTVVLRKRSGPKSRSSAYKGVTQYKKTGRWEAHIWLPNPNGRGSQRHLGSYETAEHAAKAFDRATIHLRGKQEELNFPWSDYENDDFLRVRVVAYFFCLLWPVFKVC